MKKEKEKNKNIKEKKMTPASEILKEEIEKNGANKDWWIDITPKSGCSITVKPSK